MADSSARLFALRPCGATSKAAIEPASFRKKRRIAFNPKAAQIVVLVADCNSFEEQTLEVTRLHFQHLVESCLALGVELNG